MEYFEAIKYAKNLIRNSNLPICPEDLVHDSFLKGDLSKSSIRNCYCNELRQKQKQLLLSDSKLNGHSTKQCKECKEVLPMNSFKLIIRKKPFDGYRYYSAYCLGCLPKINSVRNDNKKRNNPEKYKLLCKKASQNHYQRHKHSGKYKLRQKKARNDHYERSKRLLTDGYVKAVIRTKGYKAKDITPEMINIERQAILRFRLEKQLLNIISDKSHDKPDQLNSRQKKSSVIINAFISDCYIKIQLAKKFKAEDITKAMITKKRKSIIAFRLKKILKETELGAMQITKDRITKHKEYARNQIKIISDTYVRSLLRRSGLKEVEIFPELIVATRKKIKLQRKKKQKLLTSKKLNGK